MNKYETLDRIASKIGDFCVRWGRIQVTQTKEKYGTVRVYCSFGIGTLYNVIRPGYHWIGKEWYWRLSYKIKLHHLHWIVVPYQIIVYRFAYKKAVEKYPELKEEILSCADWPEYLEGL